MMKNRVMSIFLAALLAAGFSAVAETKPFIAGLVPSESGFDGAVRVIEEKAEGNLGVVTVIVPYRDMRAQPKEGQARVVISKRALEKTRLLPLFCHVHYEKGVDGARTWCERGWAVVTPHYDAAAGFPIDVAVGDSDNLARAIIQWARRLPFADLTRLHIDGGSQGGYMALAMGAEFLPTSITPDAPVVNWAYNLNYFEANRELAQFGAVPPQESAIPVMAVVSELASERMKSSPVPGCYGVLGTDLASEAWRRINPIAYLHRITCPVLIQIATGDILVPHEQMTDRFPQDRCAAGFPGGYARDFDALAPSDGTRMTFEEAVQPDTVHWALIPKPRELSEFSRDHIFGKKKMPPSRAPRIDRPWSPDFQWNVAVFLEGPPRPWSGHTRFNWPCSPDSFIEHYQSAKPSPGILDASKLERLLERYSGALGGVPDLPDGTPANRLNYDTVEKLDVLTALTGFADMGRRHYARRLQRLYASGDLKPFGEALSVGQLRQECSDLREQMRLPASQKAK